ncbi:MAG TPA: FKBP-type peptidyl-prolyl cis-trans isomerase [Burkholderiales bacterium]|jgi:FKBP-type peptidyl-prolyl cis-trans isomerase|nr:FKBP-type peptidyl-prolyl cis-trans isomerase [Burkholderiales bacterium]
MKRGRGGVEYEDLEVGSGPTADRGCTVEVEYSLFLNRGDRVQEKKKYSFRVGERRVIAGLEYGVEGMRAGGKRRIRVGPHLAYRDGGVPDTIPANAVLEFHVSLLNVRSSNDQAA